MDFYYIDKYGASRSAIAIFSFILIISGNYLGTLFPCRVQDAFGRNKTLRHILGFFTLLFFVLLTTPNFNDEENKVQITTHMIRTLRLYIFFLVLSKTHIHVWVTVFCMGCIVYILELHQEDIIMNRTRAEDSLIPYRYITITQHTIIAFSILVTFVGFLIYMGEKKAEYKSKFSYFTFILGKSQCAHYTGNRSTLNSIKHIFD